MCGIAGIVRFDRPATATRAAVARMLQRLRHRGPDDMGVHVGSWATLGNTRLSLVDRAGGAQPMSSPDHRWHLTYNGEIYNWPELRAELSERWDFRTASDTEVVLAALATWGEAALPRFNGMFALFLWDEQAQAGFAARDRLGVKPFVFAHDGDGFAFASEAKALLALERVTPRADRAAILEYFVAPYFSGVERPMFAGLRHLPAGQCLRISRTGLEMNAWWDWARPDAWREDEPALAATLAEQLGGGVGRALQTPHAVGSFLSGGLDSTLLTALAAQRSRAPVKTFTIQFEEQAQFDYRRSTIVRSDDTPWAEAAAREIGVEHTLVHVSRAGLGRELQLLAASNDTLPAWEQELAQHHLARAAHDSGLRCVLVGDAADETHYGYPFLLDDEATQSPAGILRRFGLPPLHPEFRDGAAETLDRRYRELAEAAGHRWDTPLSRVAATTYLIVKRWLPRLLQNGDLHTMAFSVEARVPFADTELVGLAQVVHPCMALRDGREKDLLRQAARGLMPERCRMRPKSALPRDQQTAEVYRREAALALAESASFLGHWLDLAALRDWCRPGRDLEESERALLFRVIALHHWQRHYGVLPP